MKTILAGSMLIAMAGGGGAAAQTTAPAKPSASAPAQGGVTEPRARMALMEKGYSNVSTLKKDSNGDWIGNAMKGGQTVNVKVTPDGQVASP
jgi:hypothetical protein